MEILDGVPHTWNLIPFDITIMDQEDKEELMEIYGKGLVSIAQQGYDHTDNGFYSEFKGLGYKEQKERIEKGRKIIEDEFGFTPEVFIPPFNIADMTTKEILEELGYKAYSSNQGDPASFEVSTVNKYDQLDF